MRPDRIVPLLFLALHLPGAESPVIQGTVPGEAVAGGVRVPLGSPPVHLNIPDGRGDLSARTAVAVDLRNPGAVPVAVRGMLSGHPWCDGAAVIAPGATVTLEILLKRDRADPTWAARFPGMNGLPGGHVGLWSTADPAHLAGIDLMALDGTGAVDVLAVRATGTYGAPPSAGFLPFVDRWGQDRHRTWPGKVTADADLPRQRQEEAADLAAHPGPTGWDAWGGWATGPHLPATGRFRTTKHAGRWWLVDPDGHLFWSHGVTCVGIRPWTPIAHREDWFAELPAAFVAKGNFDPVGANLRHKFGPGWEAADAAQTHRRVRSWGLNTLGNWSSDSLAAQHRTPYTVAIHYGGPKDAHGFPQVRDPGFRTALRERLEREKTTTAQDPWCLGYFIDNELTWPSQDRAALAQEYYRTCLDELRRVAPKALYLGSRLHGHDQVYGADEDVARAAATLCDVVSVNRYRFTPSDLRQPAGSDTPLLIGEFHWGALDRGLLHPGLRSVADQAQRGALYAHYVTQALAHPQIVGAHWFQWYDEPLTGRGDGENYQCGFVDVADRPYAETIAASRAVGAELYRRRSAGPPAP